MTHPADISDDRRLPPANSDAPVDEWRSESQDSEPKAHEMRQRFLQQVQAAIDSLDIDGLSFGRAELLQFAKVVLKRADDRYLQTHSGRNLTAQLADSLQFVHRRRLGEIEVRVFNPEVHTHGYHVEGTIIETLMDDQPFIFDTLKLCLSHQSLPLRNSTNVILGVERAEDGTLARLHPSVSGGHKESYCRLFVEQVESAEGREALAAIVLDRLQRSRRMVRDFHRMKKHTLDAAGDYGYLPSILAFEPFAPFLKEAAAFLEWLLEDHFLFMGAAFYEIDSAGIATERHDFALGIRAHQAPGERPVLADVLQFFSPQRGVDKYFVQVKKSQEESLVHRAGKVDEVLIRRFDIEGRVAGGLVLQGLFTYKAIASAGGTIPVLRRKMAELPQLDDIPTDAYLYKATEDAFNSLPVEYLFNANAAEISRLISMMLRADNEQRMSVQLSVDTSKRHAYVFVVVPKGDYSDDLQERIEGLVKERLGATYADHRTFIGKHGTAVLHLYLSGHEAFRAVPEEQLSGEILMLCSPWSEQLRLQLVSAHGEASGNALHERYAESFDDAYRATRDPLMAAEDVRQFERLGTECRHVILFAPPSTRSSRPGAPDASRGAVVDLVLYQSDNLYLTDVLPRFNHFGLRVIDQYAHQVNLGRGRVYVVDTFRVDARECMEALNEDAARVVEALTAVFEGEMASSPLNELVLTAGLSWQQVEVFRAYMWYSRQLVANYAPDLVMRVLNSNPEAVRALARYFEAKFDPSLTPGATSPTPERLSAVQSAKDTFDQALQEVTSFVEDRILFGFFNLMDATLRTNAFRGDRKSAYLSLKFDCERVSQMSEPRPWREIYVHSVNVEGVHLRGGPVARGGIRWSDRLDDYRTEVLGLMTTQMVKNTVIVPVGAKGGFVLRNMPTSDADQRSYADDMYKVFIRGLLDVTDNRVGGDVVPPLDVVRYDGDDPYLVVAADKGTAHLSDTANALSAEYGFWLGDAFASGGSNGYDHKVEGITAKGAWACVREHFRELGLDPERDIIRVVGIGDMSGDVFGNGLLLSRSLKLVGAFNHRHIFIDPDPDPEVSFKERQRLFALPRSSWRDYDVAAMSNGGGIYERSAKSITLSHQAVGMLGLDATTLSPSELITRLLTLDVDLIWNGGIGTYVKASWEDHRAAGDRTNDDVRVDASQLRAKVLGEGGNLGLTQAARVEWALRGGHVNTDFVDNAGGVNLSDHEVNLKVLFAPVVARGDLGIEKRNLLLRRLAPEVVAAVVEDNVLLSLRLSLDELRSKRDVFAFGRTIKALKRSGHLNPARQKLPNLKRLIERAADARGLVRPELATLGSHAKMAVFEQLVVADPLPHAVGRRFLQSYFPPTVYDGFGADIENHLLVHELVSTVATNHIVEFAGTTFFAELVSDTERSVADIALTYLIANELLDAWSLKSAVRDKSLGLTAQAEQHAILAIEDALHDVVVLFLHTLKPGQVRSWTESEVQVRMSFATAAVSELASWLGDSETSGMAERARYLHAQGVPQALALRVATLPYAVAALAAWSVAEVRGADPMTLLALYVQLATSFGIARLHQRLVRFTSPDQWEVLAIRALRRVFFEHHGALTQAAAREQAASGDAGFSIVAWLTAHPDLASLADEVRKASEHEPSIAALVVLSDRLTKALRNLA